MLAADSGLAPPPSNYTRTRPSDDPSQQNAASRADQSSESTVRSRNNIDRGERKSATQKLTKKKADGISEDLVKNNSMPHGRKKSQTKLYAGKLTDSTGMPQMGDFMPQPLDHRQSQQLAQSNALSFG